jgi:adenylyltransferase/sulfurtransferase
LLDLNPHVELRMHEEPLTTANALAIVGAYDVVVDGTDQFATRYLVNDACVMTGTPNVYGSVHRFEGQVSVFATKGGPCYRCLFPEPPVAGSVPSCAEGGVLGVLPGIVGSLQAAEAIKLILGIGAPLVGRLLYFDALSMRAREMTFDRDTMCPVCGDGATPALLDDYDVFCGTTTPSTGPTMTDEGVDMTPTELKERLAARVPTWLLDVREAWEHSTARIEGATLIPLGELASRADEVPRDADVVVYCHHGMRSARAVDILRRAGWQRVRNLTGGIDRWSIEADPKTPRY